MSKSGGFFCYACLYIRLFHQLALDTEILKLRKINKAIEMVLGKSTPSVKYISLKIISLREKYISKRRHGKYFFYINEMKWFFVNNILSNIPNKLLSGSAFMIRDSCFHSNVHLFHTESMISRTKNL